VTYKENINLCLLFTGSVAHDETAQGILKQSKVRADCVFSLSTQLLLGRGVMDASQKLHQMFSSYKRILHHVQWKLHWTHFGVSLLSSSLFFYI